MYISRACNEVILTQGAKALRGIQNGYDNEEVETVIEANILLSGLGFENSGCAGAHSISKGISAVKECENLLHGEKVAFGTLCQLIAEKQIDEYNVLLDFYNEVGLPITLSDLGIKTNKQIKIEQIALESMIGGFWNNEPFIISLEGIMNYIKEADARGLEYKLIQIKE